MWNAMSLGYFPAITRNEVQTHGIVWMNLENIKACERGQIQKATYYMSLLYEMYQIVKSVETECRLVASRS